MKLKLLVVSFCVVVAVVSLAIDFNDFAVDTAPPNIEIEFLAKNCSKCCSLPYTGCEIHDNATSDEFAIPETIDMNYSFEFAGTDGYLETTSDVNMEEFKESCDFFHRAYQAIKNEQFGISGEVSETIDTNEYSWIIWESSEPPDILFEGPPDVLFEWNDGKFNVVYDANNCTEAAKTFLTFMLPYLNEHIEEKAKELVIEKESQK